MIKFIQALQKQRLLIILMLSLPILGIFFTGRFSLESMPESPNPRFDVRFFVPNRQATEIVARVTEPAEKIFNGLPGLISMQSETKDHYSRVELIFNDNVSRKTAYLYVQEKLDMIKLQLPGDVETTSVESVERDEIADLEILFEREVSIKSLRDALSPLRAGIRRSNPDIEEMLKIKIVPDPLQMAKSGVSISQITEVMKLTGISSTIGKENGIVFGIGRSFDNLGDIQRTVIATKGHRIIRLSDVATVELQAPVTTDKLRLHVDYTRLDKSDILKHIEVIGAGFKTKSPKFRSLLAQSRQTVLGFIAIVLLQIYFFRRIFGKGLALSSLALFNGLVIAHYIFWRGLATGGLTILDFHGVILTIIIGTAFWITLFARIRTYFLPEFKLKKVPKTIEQANLFVFAELLPTFSLLVIIFALFELPVLTTSINHPSRYILNGFLWTGVPVLFTILVFMPLLVDYGWIQDSKRVIGVRVNWVTTRKSSRFVFIGIFILSLIFASAMKWFPLGVSALLTDQEATALAKLRGYDKRLGWLLQVDEKTGRNGILDDGTAVIRNKNERRLYNVWNITPSGLRFVADLNLASLSPALRQIEFEEGIGFLKEDSDRIPLNFNRSEFSRIEAGELLLSKKPDHEGKARDAMKFRLIADQELQLVSSHIHRGKMIVADEIIRPMDATKSNLKIAPKVPGLIPSQWTDYFLSQVERFESAHWMALLFCALVIALYMNSFIRSVALVIYTLAMMAGILLLYLVLPGSFHVDSLWMLHLIPWFSLAGYFIICRIIDVERSRGFDREECLEEIQVQFAPAVLSALRFSLIAQFILGVLDFIPWVQGTGMWMEAMMCSLLGALGTYMLFVFIFPVIYLKSEEYVDDAIYKVIKLPIIRKLVKKLLKA